MVSISQFICLYSLLLTTKLASSQQSYDPTHCSDSQVPSSNYLCNSNKHPCQAFTLYRAQRNFQTLSSISSLFNLDHTLLLPFNHLTKPTSHDLYPGQEIIVPLNCSCSGRFSEAVLMYNASGSDTFPQIACGVFEGLLKPQTLVEHNPNSAGKNINGFQVTVPVRCACPDKLDRRNGVKYLVTYPILENDNTTFMAHKFGIPEELIWAANGLDQFSAVFPESTLLIPTKGIPYLNSEYTSRPDIPSPGPPTAIPLEKIAPHKKARNLYIPLGIGALIMILFLVVASGFFIIRKRHLRSFQPLSTKSSQMSSFSPDFLDGMSKLKHSLLNFSLEELRIATEDFSEASAIGTSVYRGRIGSSLCLSLQPMVA